VRLRPLEPRDYPLLRRQELDEQLAFRWRHHGRHVAPDEYMAGLWNDALAHFIVESTVSSKALGIVSAYNANMETQTVYVGIAKFDAEFTFVSPMVGAAGLLFDYLFTGWPLRKIYLETAEYNYGQFDGGLGWLFLEEARFREHVFLRDRFWDLIVVALWRDSWLKYREELLRYA
jgi:hypothetical protein